MHNNWCMGPQDDNLKRRDILQSIQKLDSNISFLNQQKQQLLLQLKSNSIGERSVTISEVISSEEKVKLFKELFRGRTDVYAKERPSERPARPAPRQAEADASGAPGAPSRARWLKAISLETDFPDQLGKRLFHAGMFPEMPG